jgi:serine/threonine protein kinase/tetratricopeptide (TPR) repeat protein
MVLLTHEDYSAAGRSTQHSPRSSEDPLNPRTAFDEDLIRRLPLPVARICRRAHNAQAKSSLELHQAAYYLWEVSLKLLASTAIVAYAERGEHDPDLAECLKKLSRPGLGHWWEFVRKLLPVMADDGDPGFAQAREFILGRERNDLPKVTALRAALLKVDGEAIGARSKVRLSELFDRLVKYRNDHPGHGALGMGDPDEYRRIGRALLAGAGELLARVDFLAGRRMIFIEDVRRRADGGWLIERFELIGEAPRRIESIALAECHTSRLPHPARIYLDVPGVEDCPPTTMLHPLAIYDPEESMVLLLNSRRDKGTEYLSYTSGRHLNRPDLGEERRALLARVLHSRIDEAQFAAMEAEAKAEQDREEARPEPAAAVGAPLRSLGEFELLSELGRGNMGVVYRAWQPSLGRQIAVKRSLRSGDPKTEARFQREIRAMGRVDHPNLIKVFSSGFEGEYWFYAMELVEGTTLSAIGEVLISCGSTAADFNLSSWRDSLSSACAATRQGEKPLGDDAREAAAPYRAPGSRDPASPPDRDYIRQIVDLLRQTALAAQALHEVGVVHRDIKPGNIMVTADGDHAVLIDLGLAQLADAVDGKLTKTREFVGTLRYASPEQVLSVGAVDHRTDIYSLGATLWELLTLRPIFSATGDTPTPTLMQRITIEEPDRVRKFNPKISRDLESIVHKCLEKDVVRRYTTAADLAADLGRYLQGEPVAAQSPSFSYLASKFVRRHKAALATAAAVLLIIVGGTVAAFVNLDAARRATEKALEKSEANRLSAQTNFKLAEARFDEKRGALDQMLEQFSDARLRNIPGTQEIRQVMFEKGIDLYEKILRERRDDIAIRVQLAERYQELGALRRDINVMDRAVASLESAIQYRRQIAAAELANPAHRAGLGNSLYELGECLWQQNRAKEAAAVFRESASTFEDLSARFSEDATFKAGWARSLDRLTTADPGEDPLAAEEKALRLISEAVEARPDDVDLQVRKSRILFRLGYAYDNRKDSTKALALYDEARRVAEKALAKEPTSLVANRVRTISLNDRALVLRDSGQLEEAAKLLEGAVRDAKLFARQNPALILAHDSRLVAQQNLADIYQRLASYDRAIDTWEDIAKCAEGLKQSDPRNPDHPRLRAWALLSISEIERARSRWDKAAIALDRAVIGASEDVRAHPGHDALLSNLVRAFSRRGDLEWTAGRYREALPFYEEGMSLYETSVRRQGGPPGDALSQYLNCASSGNTCLSELKDHPAAIRLIERAIPMGRSLVEVDVRHTWAGLLGNLADHLEAMGQTDRAIAYRVEERQELAGLLDRKPEDVFCGRSILAGPNSALAQLYKSCGRLSDEMAAMREFLKAQSYRDGKDYGPLLAETVAVNEQNAKRLRTALDAANARGMMTLPMSVYFGGISYPFTFYISESYKFTEDQIRWVERVRGGQCKAIETALAKLAELAKQQNLSFKHLCSYAFAMSDLKEDVQQKVGVLEGNIAHLKAGLAGAAEGQHSSARLRLAEEYTRLAWLYQDTKSANALNAARGALKEAFALIEATAAVPEDEGRAAALGEAFYVRGLIELADRQFEKGEGTLEESLRLARPGPGRFPEGTREVALGQVARELGRPSEAVLWSWRAAERGRPEGVEQIARVYLDNPKAVAGLPRPFVDELATVAGKFSGPSRAEHFQKAMVEAWEKYRIGRSWEMEITKSLQDYCANLLANDRFEEYLRAGEALVMLAPEEVGPRRALARSLGTLRRWKEAVARYLEVVAMEPGHADSITGDELNLMEAYICADDADGLLRYLEVREARSKQPLSKAGQSDAALYLGLKAIGMRMKGLDSAPIEVEMRRKLGPNHRGLTGRSWAQLDDWLKRNKLDPQRKIAATRVLDDMKGKEGQQAAPKVAGGADGDAVKMADAIADLYVLTTGLSDDRKPFWAIVDVKPSKTQAFKEFFLTRNWTTTCVGVSMQSKAAPPAKKDAPIDIGNLGIVIEAGPGKNPPLETWDRLKRDYGIQKDYEQELLKFLEANKSKFTEPNAKQ